MLLILDEPQPLRSVLLEGLSMNSNKDTMGYTSTQRAPFSLGKTRQTKLRFQARRPNGGSSSFAGG